MSGFRIADLMMKKRQFPFAVTLLDIQLTKYGKLSGVMRILRSFPRETFGTPTYFNPRTQRRHVEIRFKTERDMLDGIDFLEPTFRSMRIK